MKSLKITTAFAAFFLLSCSTKNQHQRNQDNLTFNLNQTSTKINTKNDFNKGLKKMKPSKNNELQKSDFLTYANNDNFEFLLKENNAALVVFGMVSNDYSAFEKKYGIKVKTENCVISPGISKLATANNIIISDYLTEKFDNDWKTDLEIMPFGLN